MKTCARCKEEKSLDSFALARRRPDGRQNWCRQCISEHQAANRDLANKRNRAWRSRNPGASSSYLRRIRWEVILHYSAGEPRCACCGESHTEFLVLDHVDGGGNAERREHGRGLFGRLRKLGFPPGYRVLCANCNTAIAYHGACPHERVGLEVAA